MPVNKSFFNRLLVATILQEFSTVKNPEAIESSVGYYFQFVSKRADEESSDLIWLKHFGNTASYGDMERMQDIIMECLSLRSPRDIGMFKWELVPKMTAETKDYFMNCFVPYCRKMLLRYAYMWYRGLSTKEGRGARSPVNGVLNAYGLTREQLQACCDKWQKKSAK